MNTKHITAIFAALLLIATCNVTSALTGYTYDDDITISNAGSGLTYYQYNFTIDSAALTSAGKMQADGGDCRIADASSNLLSFWNETAFNTASTKIWVNATSLPNGDTTHHLCYGNATANAAYNGTTTFPFFDDFNRADSLTVGNGWNETDGMWNISSHVLCGADELACIDHNFTFDESYILHGKIKRVATGRDSSIDLYGNVADRRCVLNFYDGDIRYLDSVNWQSTGKTFVPDTWYPIEITFHPTAGNTDYRLLSLSWSIAGVSPFSGSYTNIFVLSQGSSGAGSMSSSWDDIYVRKYAATLPTVSVAGGGGGTITISSPSPGIAAIRYVTNRTVTYSATPSLTADCKWAYQNGTFIEWDNSTTSPSMVRWINSSRDVAFDIRLTAYETGNNSNYVSEVWNNVIDDDAFDYTNYTWERLHVWNDEIVVGIGGNIEFGDVDNDGKDEMVLVETRTYIDYVKDIIFYNFDTGIFDTYTDASSDTRGFIEASIHDVDQDGTNELFCMYGDVADARADVFRFDTTQITGSKLHNDIMTRTSNNPKSFSWINISNREEFYTIGCGDGETTHTFLNLTTHITTEMHNGARSGEDNVAWDIDGDGDLELLTVEGYYLNQAKVYLYELNYDTGAYTSRTLLFDNDLKGATHYTANIMVGDVDNDGIDNLIIFWTPAGDPDLRISEVEAYEFDGVVNFGEGCYTEGFAIDTCDNHELGVTCGHGKYFIDDIDGDGLNEFVTGHYVYAGAYPTYHTICYVYDVPSGGSGISKYRLTDFPPWYVGGATYFIHFAVVGFHDGKCYMTVGGDSEVDGAYRTELFALKSRTEASSYTPPTPTTLTNTAGNFWVHHTYSPGFGNVTDSYNVYINTVWHNISPAYYNNDGLSAHAWSNISVYAYNSSGTGTLSAASISQNVQIPNNAIIITNTSDWSGAIGENVHVNYDATDADSDTPTFSCSRTDLFTDFSTTTGIGNWVATTNGTYHVVFGVSDGYGSVSNYAMTIQVGDAPPSTLRGTMDTNAAAAYSLAGIMPMIAIAIAILGMLGLLMYGGEMGPEAIIAAVSVVLLLVVLYVGLNIIGNIPG